ncbi:GNAT family N-acetyltransferase [Mangrovitalea sediminis]|uniref:GNAT family N-acetyltransferase n=1 Tax=Mangrovitalea sediminis TaxID=1982043 RepID=UPI000BE5ACF8|nr:GNAT family N-acetyltransferase [Mangrovitalea sediminis]
MADTHIRPATPADLEPMVALIGELFTLEADFAANPDAQRSGLRLLFEQPDSHLWVAAQGNAIVGLCTLQTLISTAEGGPVGFVEDVIVTGKVRGQGIGRRLLTAVQEWADANGLKRLQLLADRNNHPAIGFYKALGWEETQLIGLRRLPPE